MFLKTLGKGEWFCFSSLKTYPQRFYHIIKLIKNAILSNKLDGLSIVSGQSIIKQENQAASKLGNIDNQMTAKIFCYKYQPFARFIRIAVDSSEKIKQFQYSGELGSY